MSDEQKAIVTREPTKIEGAFTVRDMRARVNLIQEAMHEVMQEGQHFGLVPGCGDKPTLLQPGAQKLLQLFNLRAIVDPDKDVRVAWLDGSHLEVRVFVHILNGDGLEIATGVGSCSTLESKYRWRKTERVCPTCGKAAIIKGKAEYGGGWLCWTKKDGCGARFKDGDADIEGQQVGQRENEDIADTYNTVLKIAKKRALVDGTLTATAASDCFTQDIEDMPAEMIAKAEAPKPQEQKQEPQRASAQQGKPKQEAAPAKPLQREDGKLVLSGVYLDAVTSKSGTTGTRKWTKYGLRIGEAWYSTFEREVGEAAEAAKAGGTRVTIVYEPDAKGYLNIVSLHDGEPGPLAKMMDDDEPVPPSGKGEDVDPELGF